VRAFAKRWVRTVRAECLDWTLVWNERQLSRVLTEYLRHYNTVRPHRSLDLHPPRPTRLTLVEPRTVEAPVQRVDVLGGLIHEYRRAARVLRPRPLRTYRASGPCHRDRRTQP
jgi:hypothetical protein